MQPTQEVVVLAFRHSMLCACLAGALSAQSPVREPRREPLPVLQTISVDLGAAMQERWRLAVEPLVFGRFTLGLAGSFTTTPDGEGWRSSPIVYYETFAPTPPCNIVDPYYCQPFPAGKPSYRAWSITAHARWYPAALSFDRERQRLGVYIGEFLGYQQRRITGTQLIYPPYYGPGDSLFAPAGGGALPYPYPDPYPYPYPYPTPGPRWIERLHGWEPGAEVGARLMMGKRVIVDVGGSLRMVAIDDPYSRLRPGAADTRFVLAVGIGW